MQDSPAIRITYEARIEAPVGLLSLMSAWCGKHEGWIHSFAMDLAVRAYLIAVVIGRSLHRGAE